MLKWALVFFVLALLTAFFGFGGFISGNLMLVAKLLFFIFIVLAVISLITGRSPRDLTNL